MAPARAINFLLAVSLLTPPVQAQEIVDREVEQSRIEDFKLPPAIDEADLATPTTEFASPSSVAPQEVLPPALPGADDYRRPQGPARGGKFKVQHPGAADGLLKIDRRGYQYKVPLKDKTQATSFRAAMLTPPRISSSQSVTFNDIYGDGGPAGILGEYEWTPFRGFGALGVQIGFGFMFSRGNGRISIAGNLQRSGEIYTLFVIPLSALAIYRFEYVRRQWVVPFVNGGVTYFGLAESRDDGKNVFAGAPAAVFGGGVHIAISRLDDYSSFILSKEYGVADVWFTLEGRVVAGLRTDLNFSSQAISAGFTIDY